MRKVNNKGFTILELIVAMSILSVVIFIGYGVINGSNKTIDNQNTVSKGQLAMNDINRYLTKDLEGSDITKFEELEDSQLNSDNYEYNIGNITYIVKKDTNKKIYSLMRRNNNEAIELIKNQPMSNSIPFEIKKSNEDESIYHIKISYRERKEKTYEFEVTPRNIYITGSEEEPEEPDKEGDIEILYSHNGNSVNSNQRKIETNISIKESTDYYKENPYNNDYYDLNNMKNTKIHLFINNTSNPQINVTSEGIGPHNITKMYKNISKVRKLQIYTKGVLDLESYPSDIKKNGDFYELDLTEGQHNITLGVDISKLEENENCKLVINLIEGIGDGSIENPKPIPPDPEVDPEIQGEGKNGYISFQYGDFDSKSGKDIKVSVGIVLEDGTKKELNSQIGKYTQDIFDIYTKITTANNNGVVDTKMNNSIGYDKFVKDQVYFGQMEVNQVNISVMEGFSMFNLDLNRDTSNYNKVMSSGKYSFPVYMDVGGHGAYIRGKMHVLDKSRSGAIIITFGKSKQ